MDPDSTMYTPSLRQPFELLLRNAALREEWGTTHATLLTLNEIWPTLHMHAGPFAAQPVMEFMIVLYLQWQGYTLRNDYWGVCLLDEMYCIAELHTRRMGGLQNRTVIDCIEIAFKDRLKGGGGYLVGARS